MPNKIDRRRDLLTGMQIRPATETGTHRRLTDLGNRTDHRTDTTRNQIGSITSETRIHTGSRIDTTPNLSRTASQRSRGSQIDTTPNLSRTASRRSRGSQIDMMPNLSHTASPRSRRKTPTENQIGSRIVAVLIGSLGHLLRLNRPQWWQDHCSDRQNRNRTSFEIWEQRDASKKSLKTHVVTHDARM